MELNKNMKKVKKFEELNEYGSFQPNIKGRFFFDSDSDGHWYMIPAELKQKWSAMTMNDFDDDYGRVEEFEHYFGDYRLGGGISQITFENPKKEK